MTACTQRLLHLHDQLRPDTYTTMKCVVWTTVESLLRQFATTRKKLVHVPVGPSEDLTWLLSSVTTDFNRLTHIFNRLALWKRILFGDESCFLYLWDVLDWRVCNIQQAAVNKLIYSTQRRCPALQNANGDYTGYLMGSFEHWSPMYLIDFCCNSVWLFLPMCLHCLLIVNFMYLHKLIKNL